MRLSQLDNLNGAIAFSFAWATFSGWTIQQWAAFAALIYTIVLLVEKGYRLWQNWKNNRVP